jgi:hypothetical protein
MGNSNCLQSVGEMKKMLKDQDNLLRLALGISPQAGDSGGSKTSEKQSEGSQQSSSSN